VQRILLFIYKDTLVCLVGGIRLTLFTFCRPVGGTCWSRGHVVRCGQHLPAHLGAAFTRRVECVPHVKRAGTVCLEVAKNALLAM